ncbi:MAG: ThiF family adenylyltransferase, partial [Actinomycetota bacterium]|nr:ThiF family adenylyltransferase [Actinomycetota bacterium]
SFIAVRSAMTDFLQSPGIPADANELGSVARGYMAALSHNPNFELVEIRRIEERGVFIVDALAGIPPRSPYGVRPVERFAIETRQDQEPLVHAIRVDFPHLPHQNPAPAGKPIQLCLSEVPWEEARATETPSRRVRRITEWLERAGWGKLYAPDQPLEPYVFSVDRLIVPSDLFERGSHTLYAVVRDGELLAIRPLSAVSPETAARYLVMPLTANPTDEQVIQSWPSDFAELTTLLEALDIPLVDSVRRATKTFTLGDSQPILDLHWLFLVRIPRLTPGRSTDSEALAFLRQGCTIRERGEALGVLVVGAGMTGLDLADLAGAEREYDLALGVPFPLNPVPQLTRALARRMSGYGQLDHDWQISIVGVGAIGSSVALNLSRLGETPGVLVDHDTVLPHNLARYQLPPGAVGMNKAQCVALMASSICGDAEAPVFFAQDVLKLEDDSDASKVLGSTQLVVDCTTSRAAMRRLARMPSLERRASCYMTVSGLDLVVISEGMNGEARIDDLDVQFSYACAMDPRLEGVLARQNAGYVRYAGGCSDLSSVIDGIAMATLSAIASSRVRNLHEEHDAAVRVWRYKESGPSVEVVDPQVFPVSVRDFAVDWQFRMSGLAVEQMRRFRLGKLPDETGGVLLGAFDVHHRVVYVSGVLPSPPDSEEWPTSYIRGSRGLRAQVGRVSRLSGDEIGYVGEWHTHPAGCEALLSSDDTLALIDLTENMGREGLPGVVVVLSDDEQWEVGLTFLV